MVKNVVDDNDENFDPILDGSDSLDSDEFLNYDTVVELECGDRAFAWYPLQETEYCFICKKYSKVIREA